MFLLELVVRPQCTFRACLETVVRTFPSLTEKDGCGQVYDITDRDTLERVRHWVKELRTVVRNKTLSVPIACTHIPVVLPY